MDFRITGNLETSVSGLIVPIPLARLYNMFVHPPSGNWTMAITARHKKSLGTDSANLMDINTENSSDNNANKILLVFDLTCPGAYTSQLDRSAW